jgi:hypothetical protein
MINKHTKKEQEISKKTQKRRSFLAFKKFSFFIKKARFSPGFLNIIMEEFTPLITILQDLPVIVLHVPGSLPIRGHQ